MNKLQEFVNCSRPIMMCDLSLLEYDAHDTAVPIGTISVDHSRSELAEEILLRPLICNETNRPVSMSIADLVLHCYVIPLSFDEALNTFGSDPTQEIEIPKDFLIKHYFLPDEMQSTGIKYIQHLLTID